MLRAVFCFDHQVKGSQPASREVFVDHTQFFTATEMQVLIAHVDDQTGFGYGRVAGSASLADAPMMGDFKAPCKSDNAAKVRECSRFWLWDADGSV